MPALKTLAGKLLLVPLAIENGLVLAGGLAGTMMWLSTEALEVESSDPWEGFLSSCLTFSRRVSLTFLILGGVAWLLHRVRRRITAAPMGGDAEALQGWFFLVTLILGVHGALAVIFARPLLFLYQENIQLLQTWGVWEGLKRGGEFSVIYLVPVFGILAAPSLAALTAFAFIAGAVASLGYLFLDLRECPRVLVRSICLQIAFLLGLFFTQSLLEAGTRIATEGFTGPDDLELKSKVVPWLAGQASILAQMARHVAWLLPGFFFCAAVVLRKVHERDSRGEEMPMQFPEEIAMTESTHVELPVRSLEIDERFKQKNHSIKWK